MFEREDLVEEALDFEFIFADACGFVPVYFRTSNDAVCQSYRTYAFAFAPVPKAIPAH